MNFITNTKLFIVHAFAFAFEFEKNARVYMAPPHSWWFHVRVYWCVSVRLSKVIRSYDNDEHTQENLETEIHSERASERKKEREWKEEKICIQQALGAECELNEWGGMNHRPEENKTSAQNNDAIVFVVRCENLFVSIACKCVYAALDKSN